MAAYNGEKLREEGACVRCYLLIGQSNMAGRGEIGEVPDIINPHCFMLRNGRFQPMREPINIDRPVFGPPGSFRSGIGPGASFADSLQRAVGGDVGLIPCAEGGSALREWMPGTLLYDHAVMQTRLAARSGTVSGILWHQGENDCDSRADADAYLDRLLALIPSFRRDIGAGDIPFLIGGLGDFIARDPGAVGYDTVQTALRRAAGMVENAAYVSAAGLECKPDGIHFTSAAARILGVRYCEALLSLGQQSTV